MARRRVFELAAFVLGFTAIVTVSGLVAKWLWFLVLPLVALAVADVTQRKRSLLRNYPVVGHLRYLLERIRPEVRQYFGESDLDGRPLDRETRSLVYQRAKGELQTVPFGTKRDLSVAGAEWIPHAMAPAPRLDIEPRLRVGGPQCARPYEASRLNIAPMSYGALSATAIAALNRGARLGGFAHNTGEGGLSPHHLAYGGDLIWQIGTGYFGCRTPDGRFDPRRFADVATIPAVKMVELKLSQGAKPGYGGILPAKKLTPEIARLRGVPLGQACVSPAGHSAFSTPGELLELVAWMRELSGGKPVGLKLCVGRPQDLFALCKAMLSTGLRPDFISVDGAEAGTGAAPLEFANHVGFPLAEGLRVVDAGLRGVGLRDDVRVFASGRVATGFDLFRAIALGADGAFAGRAMMLALGCIQALRCHSNDCPVGVATQDQRLASALDPADKGERVHRYHAETIASLLALTAAAGLSGPEHIGPEHIVRRTANGAVVPLSLLYPPVKEGAFLAGQLPADWGGEWHRARADAF